MRRRRSDMPRRRRDGFTLVEMLVVIGVIVLLVGLTVAVIPIIDEQAKRRETSSILTVLGMAVEEWQLQADRSVTYGEPGVPPGATYDIDETAAFAKQAGPLVELISRNSQVKTILSQIDADFLEHDPDATTTPKYRVTDAWGSTIYVVYPGREWIDGLDAPGDRDEDGTLRTLVEKVMGSAVNRRVGFVSSGPDRSLGNLRLDRESFEDLSESERTEAERAADNLYSYDLSRERREP